MSALPHLKLQEIKEQYGDKLFSIITGQRAGELISEMGGAVNPDDEAWHDVRKNRNEAYDSDYDRFQLGVQMGTGFGE
jgi:hypothetical protein